MLENSNIMISNKEKINKHETKYMIGAINGEGRMYCIDLYNGIQVIYNNFHCYNAPKTDVDNSRNNAIAQIINFFISFEFRGLFIYLNSL